MQSRCRKVQRASARCRVAANTMKSACCSEFSVAVAGAEWILRRESLPAAQQRESAVWGELSFLSDSPAAWDRHPSLCRNPRFGARSGGATPCSLAVDWAPRPVPVREGFSFHRASRADRLDAMGARTKAASVVRLPRPCLALRMDFAARRGVECARHVRRECALQVRDLELAVV